MKPSARLGLASVTEKVTEGAQPGACIAVCHGVKNVYVGD